VGREVVLGDLVFALAALALDHRDSLRPGEPPHPAREPAGHPHQVGVVELFVAALVQPPPPRPEPARRVTQRVVGVEHDPVHAVVAAEQKIPVALTESVDHRGRFPRRKLPISCPKGQPFWAAVGRTPAPPNCDRVPGGVAGCVERFEAVVADETGE